MDPRSLAASVLKAAGGYQVSMPAGANDVVITLNGAEVLRISLGAIMSIKSQNDLSFEAPNITLKAGSNLRLEAGTSIALKAGSMMTLDSGMSMTVKSASVLDLKGGIVDVNNGALTVS